MSETEDTKTCEQCGRCFQRGRGEWAQRWAKRRFCTTQCFYAFAHTTEAIAERFWIKVDIQPCHECCWPWRELLDKAGYGRFGLEAGRMVAAHRVSFFLTRGHWPTPNGCHSCDNPICSNPSHIWEGTQADNIADKVRKGRHPIGSRHYGAKLREPDIIVIRELDASGVALPDIAGRYDVSPRAISDIIIGKTWRHVG